MKHLPSIGLFAFGLLVCLYYGRLGFMPLDQSIVFDGGWRVLSGQVPFRDYVAPNGFAVHALQALFFAAGGVSWLSYCVHAAVVNGLFAVLVDRVLTLLGASRALAFGYAAASALVLYPPIGVPYMDTHAFFFSFAALWLALEGRRLEREHTRASWPWRLLPVVMVFAGLSKQIPSVFVLAPVVTLVLWRAPGRVLGRLRGLAVGAGGVAVVLAVAGTLLGVDPDLAATYFFALPAEEASRRLAEEPTGPAAFWDEALSLEMLSIASVQAVLAIALALSARSRQWHRALLLAVLAESLIGIGLLFGVFTENQPELAVGYVFAAVGITHLAVVKLAGATGTSRPGFVWLRALGFGIALVASYDAVHFHSRVNLTRMVNDISWDAEAVAASKIELPPALSFMQWQVPPVIRYDARDLTDLVHFLTEREAGFLLIGDATVLYGLTGKPSIAPALWLHAGLTLPRPDDPRLRDYERLLLDRFVQRGARYLVVEGQHTWNHTSLADFPSLTARLRPNATPLQRFGGFRVFDLGAQ